MILTEKKGNKEIWFRFRRLLPSGHMRVSYRILFLIFTGTTSDHLTVGQNSIKVKFRPTRVKWELLLF